MRGVDRARRISEALEMASLTRTAREIMDVARQIRREAAPEGYEWPTFKGGAFVLPGDRYVDGSGAEHEARYVYFVGGRRFVANETGVPTEVGDGESLSRPVPEPVLDAYGHEISEGDDVWPLCGSRHLVAWEVSHDRVVALPFGLDDDGNRTEWLPRELTHIDPAINDSWERVERDAKISPSEYAERRGEPVHDWSAPASERMARDLVRRCRAIAERGER